MGVKDVCGAWLGAGFFCTLIWIPLLCFSLATSGVYFSIRTSGCSPLVLKGALPKPAQQFYGVTNVTSWYFGEWRVMPTRGVCPLDARTPLTNTYSKSTNSQKSKEIPGEYKKCISYSDKLPWELMDRYNNPVTMPTMADSALSLRAAYQSLLTAIFVSLVLIGVASTNIFLCINSRSGRHSMFSLFLLLEILAYFLVFLLSCIVVGAADGSSIATADGWASWFPKCNISITPLDIPGFMIWLLDLGLVLLLFLVVGEVTHRFAGGCLTRFFGPLTEAGFTKTVADLRTRHVRVCFYGAAAEGTGVAQPDEEAVRGKSAASASASGADAGAADSNSKIKHIQKNPIGGVDVIPKKIDTPRV